MKLKQGLTVTFSLVFLSLLIYLLYLFLSNIFEKLISLEANLSVGILTAAATIIVATISIALGRYFEKRKEAEAHFREKKIAIYDEFLQEILTLLLTGDKNQNPTDMVDFLRDWHRKIILWGGQNVVKAYITWHLHLKKGNPDSKTIFLMEELFRAIRKDIGHQNWKLEKGAFFHLILKNSELFLEKAKNNPSITLAEISEMEEHSK